MLLFYMDHHVKRTVTTGLRARGVDCVTAEEDGNKQSADPVLIARALVLGRVLFTQDDDFLAIGHEWLVGGKPFAGIVYAHQMRITIGQAIAELELMARLLEPAEMLNRIEYLPLR